MRRAAVVLVLALGLASCGGSSGHGPAMPTPTGQRAGGDRPASPRELIQALLDRRAQALLDRRPNAYAATAVGAQRVRDRRAARIADGLSLRDVRMQVRSVTVNGDEASVQAGAAWALAGIQGTFVGERRFTAVRRPSGWRISGVRDLRGVPPWEAGDYVQHRTGHFVVLAPSSIDVEAAGLPATLAAGYAAVQKALPKTPIRSRYLVVIAPSATEARALTVSISGIEGLAAIADSSVHEHGPAEQVTDVVSQRLLVIWPSFVALSADDRRRVMAHELTHAVLADQTSGRTPGWLVEGIALLVSGDRRDDQVAAALDGRAGEEGRIATQEFSLRTLAEPGSIGRLSGARQAGAYAYASAAAFAIARDWSPTAVLRLYDEFNDPTLKGPPGPALMDRALRRVLGVGTKALEARILASLS
jgi:hypothetical protein